jgi:2-succinyl-5-enolpyruvyl-6-hydroxy-3-cyclohexene-1-carboxylate synthase
VCCFFDYLIQYPGDGQQFCQKGVNGIDGLSSTHREAVAAQIQKFQKKE